MLNKILILSFPFLLASCQAIYPKLIGIQEHYKINISKDISKEHTDLIVTAFKEWQVKSNNILYFNISTSDFCYNNCINIIEVNSDNLIIKNEQERQNTKIAGLYFNTKEYTNIYDLLPRKPTTLVVG